MAYHTNNVVRTLRDGSVRIYDGRTPHHWVEMVCDGEFGMKVTATPSVQIKDRGVLSHLRPGEEQCVEFSLNLLVKELVSDQLITPRTPYEALMHTGRCAGWLTTNTDGGGVHTVGVLVRVNTPTSGEHDELITLAMCFDLVCDFAEAKDGNTLKVSGKAFIILPSVAHESTACETSCQVCCETQCETDCQTACETAVES